MMNLNNLIFSLSNSLVALKCKKYEIGQSSCGLVVEIEQCHANQCCKCRLGKSIGEGPKSDFSVTSVENIGISRKMSQDLKKIQEYSFFFNFFKHPKQQQRQIDTLLHKYENTTNK
jgi:hypothetical protein